LAGLFYSISANKEVREQPLRAGADQNEGAEQFFEVFVQSARDLLEHLVRDVLQAR
jgi:hypothetical protein